GPEVTQGKPEHQKVLSMWIDPKFQNVGLIDMNQDDYFEEAFKHDLVLEEHSAEIAIVGLPEHIYSGCFSPQGEYAAESDSSFANLVQPNLALAGSRFHYGHPDSVDIKTAIA